MNDTAIVVLSCAWMPHSLTEELWRAAHAKYWSECEWPVYWIADDQRGRNWGDFVAEAMGGIREPIVLLTLNDMITAAPTDHAEMLRIRDEMDAVSADYYRVCPIPECTDPFPHGRGGVHAVTEPYMRSLYPSFWEPGHLAWQAKGIGDPWSFELGAPREPVGLHCAVTRGNRPYSVTEVLKRGRWIPGSAALFSEHGLAPPEDCTA